MDSAMLMHDDERKHVGREYIPHISCGLKPSCGCFLRMFLAVKADGGLSLS